MKPISNSSCILLENEELYLNSKSSKTLIFFLKLFWKENNGVLLHYMLQREERRENKKTLNLQLSVS